MTKSPGRGRHSCKDIAMRPVVSNERIVPDDDPDAAWGPPSGKSHRLDDGAATFADGVAPDRRISRSSRSPTGSVSRTERMERAGRPPSGRGSIGPPSIYFSAAPPASVCARDPVLRRCPSGRLGPHHGRRAKMPQPGCATGKSTGRADTSRRRRARFRRLRQIRRRGVRVVDCSRLRPCRPVAAPRRWKTAGRRHVQVE